MSEQKKDPMVQFSSVKIGQNSKGNLRVQLYFKTKEEAEEFAAQVVIKSAEGAGTGCQLDIHETKGETKGGRQFTSAIGFIKSKMTQEQRAQYAPKGGYNNNGGGNGGGYKPKSGGNVDDIVNRLKNKQV